MFLAIEQRHFANVQAQNTGKSTRIAANKQRTTNNSLP
jgi:hypothetical protein